MGFYTVSCNDDHAIGAGIDKWLQDIPEPDDPEILTCEICAEPYTENDEICGEPIPEDNELGHCDNCCECPTCYPDSVRYYLPDTLGLPRAFDISTIKPSRTTLELAAFDDLAINENEDFDPFIQQLLDWTEERSWIYTYQALLKRGYMEFAKEVTATARNFDELTEPP